MDDKETQRRLAKLEALEQGGVDNWEFYSESLEGWREENHVAECIGDAIGEIDDLLAEAKVEEPAGRGAGHSIEYNDAAMFNILEMLIASANNP